jgi:hypothetical protein
MSIEGYFDKVINAVVQASKPNLFLSDYIEDTKGTCIETQNNALGVDANRLTKIYATYETNDISDDCIELQTYSTQNEARKGHKDIVKRYKERSI